MGRPPTITREQILDASRRRFAATGFGATTLADIAGELHVTPAAVLRHFASKEELFALAMRPSVEIPQCILDLESVDARTDPRIVLRRVAEGWVPFAERTISQTIVSALHKRSRAVVLPFDVDDDNSPPRRGLRLVSGYFRRAHEAGVIRIADPRAAALLFMGSLVGYVFIHTVAQGLPQPYPLAQYIDELISLWTEGGITRGRKTKSQASPAAARGVDRSKRRSPVLAADQQATPARSRRNAGSKNSQRGVSRRRTRSPRSRR
jgi:AcrR family transcriptional regulator